MSFLIHNRKGALMSRHAVGLTVLVALAGSAPAQDQGATPQETGTTETPRASYLLSDQRLHDDPQIFWEGFLTGMRGFEHFVEPVGMPIYFESPFINTQVRPFFIHHEFDDDSPIMGGDLNVYGLQARIALTERLAFIATKDGYSVLNAGLLPEDDGFNDIAAGLKYAFIVDLDNDFIATAGLRYELSNGDDEVLQGGDAGEFSPFVSVAKGFDRFHVIGALTWRIPDDDDKGNQVLNWSLHADYEILPDTLPGFTPLIEIHGNHYLTDGEGPALGIGGLDYTNLGTSDIAGETVVWTGVGARWRLTPHASLGGTFEFPLTDADEDIMGSRIMLDLVLTW